MTRCTICHSVGVDHSTALGCVAYLQRRTEPAWISVTDQLPGDGQTVLIYCPRVVWLGYIANGRWHTTNETPLMIAVSHWMPLPEPPTDTRRRQAEKESHP